MQRKNSQATSVRERFPELQRIEKEKFPYHLLIIPDGNARFAKLIRSVPLVGHRRGVQVLKTVLKDLQDLPIHIVTIWGFATDNWKRSKEEVEGLMMIFKKTLDEVLPDLLQNKSRFIHLGRKDRIPQHLKKTIEKTESETKENNHKILCVAIDFGGEDQELRIMQAVRNLPKDEKINFNVLRKLRDGHGEIPPADLIIRTSGEQRTSDIGWLAQNSEFYSIKKLLPQTRIDDFVGAIIDYSKRQRRFGERPKQK